MVKAHKKIYFASTFSLVNDDHYEPIDCYFYCIVFNIEFSEKYKVVVKILFEVQYPCF